MTNRQLFLSNIAQTTPNPLGLEIVRAEGIYLYGPHGEKYMDMISGISVSNVGHCHPAVVKAVQEQSASFMHLMVYGEYVYSPQTKLAEALMQVLPKELDNFYFTNSGTEATEGAFKLAKRYTRRSEIISCYHSYHGSTAGALSAMGDETYQTAFRPLVPGHSFIEYNNQLDIDKITEKTAAVIIELVSAEKGVIVGDYDYFQKLRKRCTEVGALLILDEIQTGCGRTGPFFSFQTSSLAPDIICTSKSLSGIGLPLAAIVFREEIDCLAPGQHSGTFRGPNLAFIAGARALEIWYRDGMQREVNRKSLFVKKILHDLFIEFSEKIKAIRGSGLIWGLEMHSRVLAETFALETFKKGLIVEICGRERSTIKILPPLIIDDDTLAAGMDIISIAIKNSVGFL